MNEHIFCGMCSNLHLDNIVLIFKVHRTPVTAGDYFKVSSVLFCSGDNDIRHKNDIASRGIAPGLMRATSGVHMLVDILSRSKCKHPIPSTIKIKTAINYEIHCVMTYIYPSLPSLPSLPLITSFGLQLTSQVKKSSSRDAHTHNTLIQSF